jgi:hypothetical protein
MCALNAVTVLGMLEQFYYTADVVYADASEMMERWRELYAEIMAAREFRALMLVDRLLAEAEYERALVLLHHILTCNAR